MCPALNTTTTRDMEEQRKKRTPILRQADGFQRGDGPPKRLRPPLFQSAFNNPQSSSSSSLARKISSLPPQLQQTVPGSIVPHPPGSSHLAAVRHQPVPALSLCQIVPSSIPMKRHEPPEIKDIQRDGRPLKASKPLSARALFAELVVPPSAAPLKPLQKHVPPVLDNPAATHLGELKALSTTPFAALADISSNNDSIELSSVLLQLQEHKTVADTQDGEEQGISLSPQRGKYIRGGLAERAAHFYKKSHTSIYLWRTAFESQPARQSTPDISFRVTKVLHTVSRGVHQPYLSITLSRVQFPVRPFSSRKQLVYVVLRFPDASKTSSYNLSHLREGCFLQIWRPWYEVTLINSDSPVTAPNASLPLSWSSNGSASIDSDENTHNIVLLCSRFVINQEA